MANKRRFSVSRDKTVFLLGRRTPNLRIGDGKGRMMRISEAERKTIARNRVMKNKKLLRKFQRGPSRPRPLV